MNRTLKKTDAGLDLRMEILLLSHPDATKPEPGKAQTNHPHVDDPLWGLVHGGSDQWRLVGIQVDGSVLELKTALTTEPTEQHAVPGDGDTYEFSGTSGKHRRAGKYRAVRLVDAHDDTIWETTFEPPMEVAQGQALTVTVAAKVMDHAVYHTVPATAGTGVQA